ncbi:MAG TPA: dTDP-glucose 4,6-dehydratase [Chthoniobacterales bacterium]|nr:dTDP-glucose 4,6-dehydratase [Chthoniobacterales bacterium]
MGKSASAPASALLVPAVRILVTGGCGFIGSNFIRYILQHYKPASVTNVDVLTYAGNLANLNGVVEEHGERYEFFKADIANADQMDALMMEHGFFAVVNFAAESHVDRSINSPENFIHTNVIGTSILLNSARRHGVQHFVQISTDEVYGSLGKTGKFTEQSPLDPSSPYSASKAGADLLTLACHRTYGQDVVVTRCSNNYGPYQFPEKLIPLMIIKALRDEPLPVYGDGMNVRDWIHVQDHCAAIVAALFEGKPGAIYNFGGDSEMANLDVVKLILKKLGKPESLISFVTDRLGHDRRYAIDSSFAQKELKWKPRKDFKEGLEETIDWYIDKQSWWQPLLERAGRY